MNPTNKRHTAQQLDKFEIMVCNCERTMDIDGERLAGMLGRDRGLHVHRHLCRSELAAFERAAAGSTPVLVACTQEAALFREVAAALLPAGAADEEADAGAAMAPLRFVNIRERAGWSEAGGKSAAKIAALLADAAHQTTPAGSISLNSSGVCLVYGAGQIALDIAQKLAGRLNVSVVLSEPGDAVPPSSVDVPIYKGRIRQAKGALGRFEIVVDGYAPVVASSRSRLDFLMPRDNASSQCDLIFDVSGGQPLFSGASRRDGYFRVDPNHPAAIAEAMFAISDMVGEFEKPLYVRYDGAICAHGRSGKVGCSKCQDNCPTGAISPAADLVEIDPAICGGCGNCSAICPTGAVSYDYPGRAELVTRGQLMLGAFAKAGGLQPVVLIHDETHGAALIAAMARFGRGLPANVLPIGIFSPTSIGHDVIAGLLAAGAERVVLLTSPAKSEDLPALEAEIALVDAILSGLGYAPGRVQLVVEADPDPVQDLLWSLAPVAGVSPHAFLASSGKRELARTALGRLHEVAPTPEGAGADMIALPAGAPYGRIKIATEGCTLCLACVSCCPANALGDNPERPQVAFTEAACVQCGLCAATCPEQVISLEPRYDFSSAAMTAVVLHEEEPFACIRCSKPFGVKSTVEKVMQRLQGKHWMFQESAQAQLIQMCDNCRVVALSEMKGDPFARGEVPRIRTTDDYLEAEAKAKASGRDPEDFLS